MKTPLTAPLAMYDLSVPAADGLATMRACARALADAGMNIEAVCYSADHGSAPIHLLVADGVAAMRIIRPLAGNVECVPVLVYTLPNRPGTLAHYCGALHDGKIDIAFMYQATAKGVVIAAADLDAVRAAFESAADRADAQTVNADS